MRRLRWLIAGLMAVGVLALVATGCGGDDGDGGSASGGDSGGGTIKIGASLPLTGEFSEPGKAAQQGYKVWEAITNENGGLLDRKVQMVIKDDASNQNTIVADYNALISKDKVDLLLGTFSSLLNLPASAVAERGRMLYVEPAGGAPELFERDFKYLFFAQQATANHQGDVWANYIASLPADQRPKTAAYPTLDDPFAQPTSEGIEAILSKAGIKTVYRETYTIDNANYDSIASSIRSKNADVVVNGATFEDGVSLVRSLLKVGFHPKWLYQTSAPSLGDQYAKGIVRGQPLDRGQDAGQRGVRRQVQGAVRRHRGARGRGRRVRRRGGPAGRRGGRRLDRRPAQARRLAARERGRHDPRPAELGGGR
jgi:branched-chain amino acid transport system substrate-binding protein